MLTLSETQSASSWFSSSNNQGLLSSMNKASDESSLWLPQETPYPVEKSNFNGGILGLEHNSTARAPVLNCYSQTMVSESSAFETMDMGRLDALSTMAEGSSSMNDHLLDRRPQTILTMHGLHDETILELTKTLIQSKKEWHMWQLL